MKICTGCSFAKYLPFNSENCRFFGWHLQTGLHVAVAVELSCTTTAKIARHKVYF
jgi:hypothetical protein